MLLDRHIVGSSAESVSSRTEETAPADKQSFLPPCVESIRRAAKESEEPREPLDEAIPRFLRVDVGCQIDPLSRSKIKAIFGLIPSCDELVTSVKEQKRAEKEAKSLGDAIARLEEQMGVSESVGVSERLGVADDVRDADHVDRSGVKLTEWLWFGSLKTNPEKANVEHFPDLITEGMTIRWDCPVCHEVMYVTREELMEHLRKCVKVLTVCYHFIVPLVF